MFSLQLLSDSRPAGTSIKSLSLSSSSSSSSSDEGEEVENSDVGEFFCRQRVRMGDGDLTGVRERAWNMGDPRNVDRAFVNLVRTGVPVLLEEAPATTAKKMGRH